MLTFCHPVSSITGIHLWDTYKFSHLTMAFYSTNKDSRVHQQAPFSSQSPLADPYQTTLFPKELTSLDQRLALPARCVLSSTLFLS